MDVSVSCEAEVGCEVEEELEDVDPGVAMILRSETPSEETREQCTTRKGCSDWERSSGMPSALCDRS